jgi:predicted acetyltransferase
LTYPRWVREREVCIDVWLGEPETSSPTLSTQLESPSLRLKDSYISLVEEFLQRREILIPFPLKFPTDDFRAFIDRLEKCAQGSEIPNGFVAHETFWLVENGAHVVGVSNLRYNLTDALRKDGGHIGFGIRPSARRRGYATLILKETLLRVRERGISRALLTAHKGNTGSVKTILRNGGVLDSEELLPGHSDVMQRFWITLN